MKGKYPTILFVLLVFTAAFLIPEKTNLNWNKKFAKDREGEVLLSNGNHKLYKCPAGYWTIGYGHNLEAHGLPESMVEEFLNTALVRTQDECESKIRGWDNLNEARKSVVIDMNFNMGWPTFSKFKKFLAALEKGDWENAAEEMEDSNWFRQVGGRAKTLQEIMLLGNYK